MYCNNTTKLIDTVANDICISECFRIDTRTELSGSDNEAEASHGLLDASRQLRQATADVAEHAGKFVSFYLSHYNVRHRCTVEKDFLSYIYIP